MICTQVYRLHCISNFYIFAESDVGSVTVIDFGNAIHNRFKEVALYFKDFELQTLLYRAPEVGFSCSIIIDVKMN